MLIRDHSGSKKFWKTFLPPMACLNCILKTRNKLENLQHSYHKKKIPKISKFLKTYILKNQTIPKIPQVLKFLNAKKYKLSEVTKRPKKLKNTELPINFESPKNLNKFQSTINTNFQNPNSKYSEVERKRVPKKL